MLDGGLEYLFSQRYLHPYQEICFGEASLVAQMVKNLPAMQETQVQSLGWEDPLEKEMTTHSSILVLGESQGQRNLAGYSPWSPKDSDTTELLRFSHE